MKTESEPQVILLLLVRLSKSQWGCGAQKTWIQIKKTDCLSFSLFPDRLNFSVDSVDSVPVMLRDSAHAQVGEIIELWPPRRKHDNTTIREQSHTFSKVPMPNLKQFRAFSLGETRLSSQKAKLGRFQHRNSRVLVWSQEQMRTGDWEFHFYITMTTKFIKIRWELRKSTTLYSKLLIMLTKILHLLQNRHVKACA